MTREEEFLLRLRRAMEDVIAAEGGQVRQPLADILEDLRQEAREAFLARDAVRIKRSEETLAGIEQNLAMRIAAERPQRAPLRMDPESGLMTGD